MNLSLIAGVSAFTNALVLFTNSTTSTVTQSDITLGTSNILIYSQDYYVKNADGNYILSSSNEPFVSIIANDGWGYQKIVPALSGAVTTNFSDFVTESLAYNCITNAQQHTNGLTPTAESMFTTIIPSSSNYMVNSSFWLKDCLERTAIVVAQNNVTAIGGSAISPRHVLNCAHAAYGPGTVLRFIDDAGTLVTRTVTARTNFGLYPTDFNVCLLDSDLPSSVHPFSVLPTNYLAWLPNLTNANAPYQLIGCNQKKKLFPKTSGSLYGIYLTAYDTSKWLGTNWNVGAMISGDSGHPIMMLVGTNLVLLSHWTYPGSGTFYSIATNYNTINSAMHYLSTNNSAGSDYQLAPFDLSTYTNY